LRHLTAIATPVRQPHLRVPLMLFFGLVLLLAQTVSVHAAPAPESFSDLVDKVSAAVVNITTTTKVATSASDQPETGTPNDLFREFQNRQRGENAPRRESALGSGFIISTDGYIVTNNHVIEGADEITVEFFDGEEAVATVIGTDLKTDIALLKVAVKRPLTAVPFGDSDHARVGEWVMAVGNPLGQGFSVSAGIISARNRALRGTYDDFIQTDAAINRGNSGGPLFNMQGEVIGVNTAILSPNGGGSIGIGFSMSSAVVSRVVKQLQEFGETRRGWLGVRIQDVSRDLADSLGLPKAMGAIVTDVPDGPGKDGGILTGDVILKFDGKDVPDSREFVRQVGEAAVGKAVKVEVYRDGQNITLDVVLARREDAEAQPVVANGTPEVPQDKEVLGLKLSTLTDELRKQLGLGEKDSGLVVMGIDESSQAYDKGLRIGDVIAEAGQVKVVTPDEFSRNLEAAREAGRTSMLLLIRRGGEPRFIALSLRE
jgi:serine protease Do